MQDFRGMDAWQKAHKLTLDVYHATHALPHEEALGLRLTLRRSAIAVATNLVEGCARESSAGFAGDLQRAIVKCNELEYLLLLARDLKLIDASLADGLGQRTIEVRKMIYGYMKKL